MARTTRTTSEQIGKYLTDVHSIEVQALAQLKYAPQIAGEPRLAEIFREHLAETHEHERMVRDALIDRGAHPSTMKDVAGRTGGWAMIAFARLNPDTPGKLAAHAYSYEGMEYAAYQLLSCAAELAGEPAIVRLAQRISRQEEAMSKRLEQGFERAVAASVAENGREAIRSELVSYLRNAHAIEAQSLALLRAGSRLAGLRPLADVFRAHLAETRQHQLQLEARLSAYEAGPSRLQDAALRVGALNLSGFFAVQPDTPAKLAGFAFAFEHLEIAAYELLGIVARRARDQETLAMTQAIVAQERSAASSVADTWPAAMSAALHKRVTLTQ